MKKLFLILILSCLAVNAENTTEEVYLDIKPFEALEYKTFTPKFDNININNKEDEDYIYKPMEYVKNEAKELFFNKNKHSD